MDQDVIRHGARRRPRRLCVRWGSSTPKKDTDSEFSARVYCGQTAVCIRIPLGVEVGLSPGDIVLDGDPAPPPLKGHSSNFRPMSVEAKRLNGLRCHLVWRWASVQATLCWIGTQLPQKKEHIHAHQILAHVYCGQMAGWMKTPLGTEVDLVTGHIVLDVVPAVRERGTAAPLFSPMSIVATVAISATAELLLTTKQVLSSC